MLTWTFCTPEPVSVAMPQRPVVVQPAVQPVSLYWPLLAGKVSVELGSPASTLKVLPFPGGCTLPPHSFPTRRSSDLPSAGRLKAYDQPVVPGAVIATVAAN